jgi:hypothetical protein
MTLKTKSNKKIIVRSQLVPSADFISFLKPVPPHLEHLSSGHTLRT